MLPTSMDPRAPISCLWCLMVLYTPKTHTQFMVHFFLPSTLRILGRSLFSVLIWYSIRGGIHLHYHQPQWFIINKQQCILANIRYRIIDLTSLELIDVNDNHHLQVIPRRTCRFSSHNDFLPHLLADDNVVVPVRLVRNGVDAHYFESYSNKIFITRDDSAGSYLIR